MASRQQIDTASSSTSGLKSTEYREQYNHDTENLRIQAAIVKGAATKMCKEQAKIKRKMKKSYSKELPGCIDKYNTCLMDLQSALKEIAEIVTEGGFPERKQKSINQEHAQTWNESKKRNRSMIQKETFNEQQTQCMFCLNKDAKIQELKKQLTRQRQENEENLNKILQSKDDLQRRYELEIQKLKHTFDGRHGEQGLRQKCEKYERMYKEEMAAKEDALCRLSAVASSKLRDKNPNITDLSDQNRPTKIAEKMTELYDNQWTEAYDALEKQKYGEEKIIQILFETFMDVYSECSELASDKFFKRVQRTIELPLQANTPEDCRVVMPDQLKQQIKEFRKTRAPTVVEEIKTVVKGRIRLKVKGTEEFQAYLSRCIEIGWLCAVQDPPLVVSYQAPHMFDTNAFREYTARGKYTKFLVWPALYLSEGGALLTKGVAQGTDKEPGSSKNAPSSAGKNKGTMSASSFEPFKDKQKVATANPHRGVKTVYVQPQTQQGSQDPRIYENMLPGQSTDL